MAIHWRIDINIVEEIVKLMAPEILECKTTDNGYTACHSAAMHGYFEAVVVTVNKNPKLTQIRDAFGRTPLEIALLCVTIEQKKIVQYLYSVTKDEDPSPFLDQDGVRLLQRAIQHNFYDLALCLIKRFPALVMKKSQEDNKCTLEALVRMPFAFRSGSKLTWWQDRIYSLMQVDMNSKYVQPVEATTCQSS
ncbi:hypothetical protein MKW98_027391 [Papaver atlanticum]|uniref:Uncharacterized protein n=1 Tax=Papaver atlanticum TaxID=357466 RepID=A0AAD4TH42_9MAGN|nr:hypothetical protein MKW98_027391 [Papaver atlanticum]